MSSAVTVFVHAIRKRSQKYLAQKVAHSGSLGPIPKFKHAFCSSYLALQYKSGMKIFF